MNLIYYKTCIALRTKKSINSNFPILLAVFLFACNENANTKQAQPKEDFAKGTYGYDKAFLKNHLSSVVELQDDAGNSKVLLSPDYQGRVMTTTAWGDSGTSFGWINYGLLSAKQKRAQFNPVGGEERFWIG